ncbi:monocarboxylate transporter 13-like [Patiria miniata]|uniref:Major facilitator superfamily (MFS) profile domain-containing protein n=1 Tax=Patiria miniata TaxID=46514 RepID=A0A914B5D7_PATMI|nr:monocarboxylate transporter 13-like [Patiria miniata]
MKQSPGKTRRGGRYTKVTSDPPEGGWGIVVVVASHLIMALVLGLIRCSGVFYQSWKNEFNTGAKETAAVQSITASLSSFSGIIGGILTKRYSCRFSGMLGGALASCGLFVSCWVANIYQLYVTAAITGAGMGITYNAGIVAVALYFKKKYKTANAIAFSGCGTGMIAAPPLLQLLSENFGWRGAVFISSAIMANGVAFCLLFRPLPRRVEQSAAESSESDDRAGPFAQGGVLVASDEGDNVEEDSITGDDRCCNAPDELQNTSDENVLSDMSNNSGYVPPKEAKKLCVAATLLKTYSELLGLNIFLKSYRFALLCLLQFQFSLPYMGFVQFLIPRAESLGVTPSSAAFLLSLFGIGTLLGRLANGVLISWRPTAEHVTAAGMTLAGLSMMLLNVDHYAVLAVVSFVKGFAIGFLVAVMVVLTRRYVGMANFALSVAIFGIFFGAGVLTGPVMAGWLLDVTGNYQTVFYVLAGVYFMCVVQILLLPLLKRIEPGIDILPSDR